MSGERLIWRPNEISLHEWEAMSRDEQARWWKDREPSPAAKPHMTMAITRYNKGHITRHEFCFFVAKIAVVEEIAEFVQNCPPNLMNALKMQLAEYGPDESKWPRVVFSTCAAPWLTVEEINDSQRCEQEQIWNGVRLLKKHLT